MFSCPLFGEERLVFPPAALPTPMLVFPSLPSSRACMQRLLSKFSPLGWSKWRWQAFSSFKRTAQVFSMIAATMLLELNAFMVMNALEVRTEEAGRAVRDRAGRLPVRSERWCCCSRIFIDCLALAPNRTAERSSSPRVSEV